MCGSFRCLVCEFTFKLITYKELQRTQDYSSSLEFEIAVCVFLHSNSTGKVKCQKKGVTNFSSSLIWLKLLSLMIDKNKFIKFTKNTMHLCCMMSAMGIGHLFFLIQQMNFPRKIEIYLIHHIFLLPIFSNLGSSLSSS